MTVSNPSLPPPGTKVRIPSGLRPLRWASSSSGAALLSVIMLIMVTTIMSTAALSLLGARLQQSERLGVGIQRHVSWRNTKAINQQYAYTWAMRDAVSRTLSTATLTATTGYVTPQREWGGQDADLISNLSAFRSTTRPSNLSTVTYPYNNIRNVPTVDNGVYFSRTTADSDATQSEHIFFYNFLKTYPTTLLGDLLLVHKRPSGASGSYELSDNLRVDGRVVIWDANAITENVRAQSCFCAHPTAARTTKNSGGSALLMPENDRATPNATAGYGGSSQPYAVADGTLRMVDNADFPAGSIRHIVEASGSYTQHTGPVLGSGVTGLIGSLLGGIVDLSAILPTSADPVIISRTTLNKLLLPSAAGSTISQLLPPLSGSTSLLNIGVIIAHHPNLPNLRMTGNLDLVIILGEILPLGITNTGNLPPRIIWVDQNSKPRHVIFVGESDRKLVFVTGRGNGQDTYVGFLGVTQLLLGGPLRWRLQWINEFTRMNVVPPPIFSYLECTGSIRTDWTFACTDSGNSDKLVLRRDTNPSGLESLMPRDGWLEPYFLVR